MTCITVYYRKIWILYNSLKKSSKLELFFGSVFILNSFSFIIHFLKFYNIHYSTHRYTHIFSEENLFQYDYYITVFKVQNFEVLKKETKQF